MIFAPLGRIVPRTRREPQALAEYRAAFDDGQCFRIALIGDSRERYLLERHFTRARLQLLRLEFLSGLRGAEVEECSRGNDLVLVSMPLPRARRLGDRWFVAPRQVSLKSNVAEVSAQISAARAPFGKYARRIRRAGFGSEIAFGSAAWHCFYSEFYEPTQRALRGARVKLRPMGEYLDYPEPPEVLAVTHAGHWVAAAAAYRDGSDYVFVELGYRHGELALRQRGAGHALYFAAFARAYGRRLDRVELGLHPPFVLDPVLHYKRQWGPRMTRTPRCQRGLAVRLGERPERGQELLARAPLVIESGGGLAVLAGHDAGVFRQRRVARELGLTAAAFHAPRSNS